MRIVGLDRPEVMQEIRCELAGRRVAEEYRELREAGLVAGQRVYLLVLEHLEAVLDAAQEAIGARHLLRDIRRDAADVREGLERRAGAGDAHLRQAPTPDQLLGLGEELDLADAAAAELDVVTEHRDPAAALVRLDLPLDRVNILDGREVQMTAPEERPELGEKALAIRHVACDRAGLDESGALPVLAGALVVGKRRQDRKRRRRGGRVGAEPEVRAEDVAILGTLVHEPHEVAGHAREELMRAMPAAVPDAVGVEQYDQVDVAGIVELPRAEFAHAKDDDAAFALGVLEVRDLELSVMVSCAEQEAERGAQARLGEFGQGSGDALERPPTRDVRQRDQERGSPLCRPKPAHETRPVLRQIAVEPVRDFGESGVGAEAGEAQQEVRLPETTKREERAVAEQRGQQPSAIRVVREGDHRGREPGIVDLGA